MTMSRKRRSRLARVISPPHAHIASARAMMYCRRENPRASTTRKKPVRWSSANEPETVSPTRMGTSKGRRPYRRTIAWHHSWMMTVPVIVPPLILREGIE